MASTNRGTKGIIRMVASVAIMTAVLTVVFAVDSSYGSSKPRTFRTPNEAFKTMIEVMKVGDKKQLFVLFGPDGKDFCHADSSKDAEAQERFVKAYDEKHRIEIVGAKKAVLHAGKDDWPWPVPVIKTAQGWRFDAKEGRAEILARRIGKNEVSAVQVCLAYVDAQREYGQMHQSNGMVEYAQQLSSDPGKKNGLCWDAKEGDKPSPIGPFVAAACKTEKETTVEFKPYHGYYYKVLKSQGNDAPGGAYEYVVNGKMIGGFGLVAYPAVYGSSGIMTFIVNQQGVVYQKDLGPNTEKIAVAMTSFDPGQSWKKVD
jgi:hypothetical protein